MLKVIQIRRQERLQINKSNSIVESADEAKLLLTEFCSGADWSYQVTWKAWLSKEFYNETFNKNKIAGTGHLFKGLDSMLFMGLLNLRIFCGSVIFVCLFGVLIVYLLLVCWFVSVNRHMGHCRLLFCLPRFPIQAGSQQNLAWN